MKANGFLCGFVAVLFPLGLLTLSLQLFLTKVGEINLANVVERQFAPGSGDILFASGIDQQAYEYKMLLLDRGKPQTFVLGSSRSMQVRENFFSSSFVNLGGAAQNIAGLELVAAHLAAANLHPRLALIFVDPWWFNARNLPSLDVAEFPPPFPKIVTAGLVFQAAAASQHGNWALASMKSKNLGIYALVTNAGFTKDGGYNYVSTLSGARPVNDAGFSDILGRINGDRDMFQKNDRASSALLARACNALRSMKKFTGHVVVIAPPFSHVVWQRMMQGGYSYIAEAYAGLRACNPDIGFYDFSDSNSLAGSVDCEFVDGVHGGNTTAARMLRRIGDADPVARTYLNIAFIDRFIMHYSGFAGGITLASHPEIKEIDFLHLGCLKSVTKREN